MRAPITPSLHIPNSNYPGVRPDKALEKGAAVAAGKTLTMGLPRDAGSSGAAA